MTLKLPSLRWYYGWNVIAMALLFQSLCIGVSYFCLPLWVIPFSDEFGVARSHIMFAIAASQVVSGLISPFGGHALDRLPPHWVISGGAITFILGLILIATAHTIWQIIIALLIPLPISMVLSGVMAAQTLATRWFTRGRGVAIALATIGSSIGGFTMPPVAAALMAAYGWRTAITAFAIATALLIVASWRVLRKEPPRDEQDDHIRGETAPLPPPTWRTSDLLRNGNFQTIVLTFLPLMFAFNAVQMNLGAYAGDLGLTQQDAAFMVAQYSLFSLIGRILFGKLIDRYDHCLLYRAIAIGLLISLAIVIGAGIVGGANGGMLLKIGIALMGFISSGYMPLNSIVIANKFGTRAFGQVTGLSNTFLGFGTTGSFVAATLRDASGSYPLAFTAFVFLALPGIWLIRRLK